MTNKQHDDQATSDSEPTRAARFMLDTYRIDEVADQFENYKIDEGAFQLALDCFPEIDSGTTTRLKAIIVLGFILREESERRPRQRYSKKELLGAFEDVIRHAKQLKTSIAKAQELSMKVIPVPNKAMHEVLVEQFFYFRFPIDEIREIAAVSKNIFEKEIKGRYIETASPIQHYIYYITVFWLSTGRVVTTTSTGEFASFLSAAYQVVYGRELSSLSRHLTLAKKYAASFESLDAVRDLMAQEMVDLAVLKTQRERDATAKNRD